MSKTIGAIVCVSAALAASGALAQEKPNLLVPGDNAQRALQNADQRKDIAEENPAPAKAEAVRKPTGDDPQMLVPGDSAMRARQNAEERKDIAEGK